MKTSRKAREHIAHDGPSVREGRKIVKTIIISRAIPEVYAACRDFENLAKYIIQIVSFSLTGDGTSHWILRKEGNQKLIWDAEIIYESLNETLFWHSLPGASVGNAGSVWFNQVDEGQGTMVNLEINFQTSVEQMLEIPVQINGQKAENKIEDALGRLKTVFETDQF